MPLLSKERYTPNNSVVSISTSGFDIGQFLHWSLSSSMLSWAICVVAPDLPWPEFAEVLVHSQAEGHVPVMADVLLLTLIFLELFCLVLLQAMGIVTASTNHTSSSAAQGGGFVFWGQGLKNIYFQYWMYVDVSLDEKRKHFLLK